MGNEYVVEYDKSLNSAVDAVAHVHLRAFQLSCVAGLTADYHKYAFGIGGNGEGDGVILIRRSHGTGGHYKHLVGVANACLMHLRSSDYNAVRPSFNYMKIEIRILLSRGREGTVALWIGHGSVHGQIGVLDVCKEFFKVLEIACAVFLIHFIGR